MKLVSQESDPWEYTLINGECVGTREHRLHLVEAFSEVSLDRLVPYVGTLNAVEFGGVPAGHLTFGFKSQRDGDCWKTVAVLTERESDVRRTYDGLAYRTMDFRDVLPRPAPFPDTSMTQGTSIVYNHQEQPPCTT